MGLLREGLVQPNCYWLWMTGQKHWILATALISCISISLKPLTLFHATIWSVSSEAEAYLIISLSGLLGRKKKVVLNNNESEWSELVSGVPQGSVLGLILFNIYVSDVPLIVNSPMVQIADDVKMFISKCYLLHLGKPHEFGKYTIDGTVTKACDIVAKRSRSTNWQTTEVLWPYHC